MKGAKKDSNSGDEASDHESKLKFCQFKFWFLFKKIFKETNQINIFSLINLLFKNKTKKIEEKNLKAKGLINFAC